MNIRGGSSSREYIYFTRNGELLYQMLSRSKHADALAEQFKTSFERRNSCDRLVELMQPERAEDRQNRSNSYLPYAKHPAFDALAQDWLAVLQLNLPRFDSYPHLAILARYISRFTSVAASVCAENTLFRL